MRWCWPTPTTGINPRDLGSPSSRAIPTRRRPARAVAAPWPCRPRWRGCRGCGSGATPRRDVRWHNDCLELRSMAPRWRGHRPASSCATARSSGAGIHRGERLEVVRRPDGSVRNWSAREEVRYTRTPYDHTRGGVVGLACERTHDLGGEHHMAATPRARPRARPRRPHRPRRDPAGDRRPGLGGASARRPERLRLRRPLRADAGADGRWLTASPFWGAGIYIGGSSMSCRTTTTDPGQPHLDALGRAPALGRVAAAADLGRPAGVLRQRLRGPDRRDPDRRLRRGRRPRSRRGGGPAVSRARRARPAAPQH